MKIKLISGSKKNIREVEVESGTSVEDLIPLAGDLPYTVLAALVNNNLVELSTKIVKPCRVELLDMRTQSANLIYQASLSLIFIKAVEDVMPNTRVEIMNSLNQGLYTEIRDPGNPKEAIEVSESRIGKIEARMRELVAGDYPFKKEIVTRRTAVKYLKQDGNTERLRLVKSAPSLQHIKFYELEGTRDFFYGYMTPSTKYIEYFELRKYRKGILVRFPLQGEPDRIPEYDDQKKLYQAFLEQTEWDELLGINYVNDLNEIIAQGRYKEAVQLSEALHEKKVAQIADMIKKQKKRIILIAGPSSSGKTTFARRLCIQLMVNGLHPLYMGTDDYFVEREDTPRDENGDYDFENLNAVDLDLFNRNMNDLLAGKTVDLPEFDFMTGHKVFGKHVTSIEPGQPIVIEGIHALNAKLTSRIPDEEKFKIYISPLTQLNIDNHNRIPTTDERMLRRLVRDYQFRGHSAKETIRNWPKVRASEDKNIFPYSGEADVLFNSYHVYEIAVLKKYAVPQLKKIRPSEKEYAEARRMLQFLEPFRELDDDSCIVNNSIIREFIGGSIFVS